MFGHDLFVVDNINEKTIMLLLSTILPNMQTTSSASTNPKSFSSVMRKILPHVLLLPSVALLLSAVMTWANVGFGDEFLPRWGRSFITSLVVLPLILVSLGALERIVDRTLTSRHWVGRKLVVAMLTALAIESVLALVVTLINNPMDSSFGPAWWMAFSRSLPAGVLIGLFMTFYMKPKMDRMAQAARSARA
ncbi:DUF2798 domain-containing protein [Polaromonas sp.]|uniref:DUF2798 domain-containing protein n=1 Tax=Polaromonas sp. TaxID=1869339 RepID=UPI001DC91874|nr:DUF2798 domain-containing protein [Polaromonas sp.]MBT9475328.1 DUF2798 domain-containing protein [Polaromonas sp.]